ncbi:hypothetical protein L1887_46127 [Cichorium endivia]|nr:hypothetical protein L1887_46127 [Cichorium endivia]
MCLWSSGGGDLDLVGLLLVGAGCVVTRLGLVRKNRLAAPLGGARAQLLEHHLVRVSLRPLFVQVVHLLDGNALGLGHEEVDVHRADHHHGREEQVDTVAHLGEHVRRRLRDDKVVQPVARRVEDLRNRSGSVVERFGTVNPGDWVVSKRIEARPNVEEDQRRGSSGVERRLLVLGRLGDGDVAGDVVHGDRTTRRRNHEQAASAHRLNKDEDEERRTGRLDDTKDSRRQESRRCARDANRLEYGRRIVVDSVNAGAVLEQEEAGCEGETTNEVLAGEEVSDVRQLFAGFLDTAALKQPTGGLDEEEGADHEHATGNKLDGEWNSPLLDAGGKGLDDTVVDEESDNATDLPADLVNADRLTTSRGRGDFGNVDGCQVRGGTDSDTGNGTTDIDGGKVGRGRGGSHDGCTDREDERADKETPLPAPEVAERVTEEGAEEGTGLVRRHEVARSVVGELAERLEERRKGDGTTDEGRVISVGSWASSARGQRICGRNFLFFCAQYVPDHDGSKRCDERKHPYSPVVDRRRGRTVLDSREEAHGCGGGWGGRWGAGVFLALSVNSVKFREMTRASNPRNMIRRQEKGYDSGVGDVAERSFKDQRRRRMAKVAGGREARCMDNDKSRGYMSCCTRPNRPSGAKLQRSYRVATGHTPCFSTGSDAAGAPPLPISTPNVIQERSVLLIAKSAASGWCARVGYTARSGAGYDHAMSSQRRSTAPLRSWRARPDTLGGRCKTGVFPTL